MPTTIIIGTTTTIGPYAVSGIEILPQLAPRDLARAPEMLLFAARCPERWTVFTPVPFPPVPIDRITPRLPMLPDSVIRPVWNPERSSVAIAMQPFAPPPAPVQFQALLPDSCARPVWNPERSNTVTPPPQVVAVHGFLVLPSIVIVNQPFTVDCVMVNPTGKLARIQQLVPQWVQADGTPSDEAGTFGQVFLTSQPSLPPSVTALIGSGFVNLVPGGQVSFGVGVVLFQAGPATLAFAVQFADGTTQLVGPATVTAVAVS